MDKSDLSGGLIKNTTEKFIDGFIETYFQPRRKPLPAIARFFFAWLGSVTLFISVIFFLEKDVDHNPFGIGHYIYGAGTILYGGLVASAKTRHGPIRLYLSGLLMSAFVVLVVSNVWT